MRDELSSGSRDLRDRLVMGVGTQDVGKETQNNFLTISDRGA